LEAAALAVLSCGVSVIPLHAFNATPTRHRGRRGEVILFRGAMAVRTARPQLSGRTGEVSE
jgi:hypothetical protein